MAKSKRASSTPRQELVRIQARRNNETYWSSANSAVCAEIAGFSAVSIFHFRPEPSYNSPGLTEAARQVCFVSCVG
jgi:hypothetical protein